MKIVFVVFGVIFLLSFCVIAYANSKLLTAIKELLKSNSDLMNNNLVICNKNFELWLMNSKLQKEAEAANENS